MNNDEMNVDFAEAPLPKVVLSSIEVLDNACTVVGKIPGRTKIKITKFRNSSANIETTIAFVAESTITLSEFRALSLFIHSDRVVAALDTTP